jgi:tellurite methyltransferase
VNRTITAYSLDEEDEWVALLSCGHSQHVRHRPPFQLREWVLDPQRRDAHIGMPLDCPLCDRAEMPNGLRLVRRSAEWDEHTMPKGLRRAHQIAAGTWGRIVVHDGHLRFAARTEPEMVTVLSAGSTQAIPPEVEHEIEPLAGVRFSIDFFSITEEDAAGRSNRTPHGRDFESAGDTACWAHLLCEECGAVLDGGPHAMECNRR